VSHVWPNPASLAPGERYRWHPDLLAVQTAGSVDLIQPIGAGSARVWRSRNRMLPRLLAHFRNANSAPSWSATQPERERADAEALLRRLVDAGYLIPPDSVPPPPEAAQAQDEADLMLQSIVVCAQQLRNDLRAIGGPCGETMDSGPRLPSLASWLQASHRMLQAVETRVTRVRVAQTTRQRQEHTGAHGALKLHLGCGAHTLPGWLNIDIAAGELRLDLRHGLPCAEQSAAIVYLGHLLEHLDYPQEALALLRETWRVLRRGGLIRVAVPDIASFAQAYVLGDQQFFQQFRAQWQRPAAPSLLADFLHYAGAGGFPHVADRHRFGYDEDTLRALLAQAGFSQIRRCRRGDSASAEAQLDYSPALTHSASGRPFTLIMEAEKV
jgi:predicted SAM-dependent methyltransferase